MKILSRRDFVKLIGINAAVFSVGAYPYSLGSKTKNPNIIYILADDLGYGDISWLNKNSKIKTSNIDSLGKNGISFIDAHSGSAVCTPTRYGILTGRYAWRTRLQNGVTWGYSRPLIDKNRMTIASFLKQHGYSTGCVGKWHLGWDWGLKDNYIESEIDEVAYEHVDFTKLIENGPADLGFDYFYGIPASLDMPPYVYIENRKVVGLPSENFEGLTDYEFARSGPASANFEHEEVMERLTEKSISFIDKQSNSIVDNPFFLYFPLSAPHTPIMPTDQFKGKSGIGPYGDFVLQCDWTVGQIIDAVKRNQIEEDTLIIFTSDNGCSPQAKFDRLESFGHDPSHVFRGHKADIFEGGHRIPFIASWSGKIPAGSFCSDPICLTDLFATASDLLNKKLPDNAGEDSVSILKDLNGTAEKPLREAIVHHSIDGLFSIRKGKWKLELTPGSGGWSFPKDYEAINMGLPMLQLYNLDKDIGEENNVQDKYPDVVNELIDLLEKYVEEGRSTPGLKQKNDAEVDIWKYLKHRKKRLNPEKIEHKAVGAEVEKLNDIQISYSAKGINAVTDGLKATNDFKDGYWAGFEGGNLKLEITLNGSSEISQVTIGFLENQNSWIFLPKSVTMLFLNDADEFEIVQEKTYEKPVRQDEIHRKEFSYEFKAVMTNKLKIYIESIKECPEWHPAKGGKAWTFLDEIIVL